MRAWFIFVLVTFFACQASAQQSKSVGTPGVPDTAEAAKIAEVIAFEKEMEAA